MVGSFALTAAQSVMGLKALSGSTITGVSKRMAKSTTMSSRPTEATRRLVEWMRQLRESSTITSPDMELPSAVLLAMPHTASQAPTSLHEAAYAPAWSPDGKLIAYTGFRDGDAGWGVYVMPSEGVVTQRIADGRNPSFAPDGKSIFYDRNGTIYRREVTR